MIVYDFHRRTLDLGIDRMALSSLTESRALQKKLQETVGQSDHKCARSDGEGAGVGFGEWGKIAAWRRGT